MGGIAAAAPCAMAELLGLTGTDVTSFYYRVVDHGTRIYIYIYSLMVQMAHFFEKLMIPSILFSHCIVTTYTGTRIDTLEKEYMTDLFFYRC